MQSINIYLIGYMYNPNIINFNQKKHEVMLESKLGLLEGVIFKGNLSSKKIALILPPDPTHKGTMNNKIVNMLFQAFEANGFTTLKINYRGVGKSKGKSDNNEAKIIDSLDALDWLIKKCDSNHISNQQICIAGFSIGGWIALQCAMRRPEITNFITINTILDTSAFNMLTPCPNGLIIQAQNDVLSKPDLVSKFHTQLITQKGCFIDYKVFDDDHYFKENFNALQDQINLYVKAMKNKPFTKI